MSILHSGHAEVPGHRGGTPPEDEAADQVLLALLRGHTRPSGTGELFTDDRLTRRFQLDLMVQLKRVSVCVCLCAHSGP